MALTSIPTEDDCYKLAMDGFRSALAGVTPAPDLSDDGFFGKVARSLVNSTYASIVAVASADRDAVPQTGSSFEGLALWATVLGLSNGTNPGGAPYGPLLPSAATGGHAVPTGAVATVIPEGAALQTADGSVQVRIYGAGTLPMATGKYATVNASTTGAISNLPIGTVLYWITTPVGADATVVLSAPTEGGSDGETAANPWPLLERIWYRLQNPPGSGRGSDFRRWGETARDATGAPIRNLRLYIYEHREGIGTVTGVPLLPGTGSARVPTLDQRTSIQEWVDALRPVCSQFFVIPPSTTRIFSVRGRAAAAAAKYDWDFDDGGGAGYSVFAWSFGPPPFITIVGSISVVAPSLKAAIDKSKTGQGQYPRLQVIASSGPIVPVPVRAVNYVDGVNSTITLENPLPSGFVAPAVGDRFFAGGPFAQQAATEMLAYCNSVGPGRGKYADPDDPWDDTIRNSRLVEIVNGLLDEDLARMANVPPNGITIDPNGGGVYLVQDLPALDVAATPEILTPKWIFVTRAA